MAIEERVVDRIEELLDEGSHLRQGNEFGQALSHRHAEACTGWIAAASNVIEIVVPDPDSGYRRSAEAIRDHEYGALIPRGVGEMVNLLSNLSKDTKAGLLSSVADSARAEVIDDFLEHANSYLTQGKHNEAGVIAGAVFEDTLRQICQRCRIEQQGKSSTA